MVKQEHNALPEEQQGIGKAKKKRNSGRRIGNDKRLKSVNGKLLERRRRRQLRRISNIFVKGRRKTRKTKENKAKLSKRDGKIESK